MFDPAGLPAELSRTDDSLGARFEDAGLTSSQPPQQDDLRRLAAAATRPARRSAHDR